LPGRPQPKQPNHRNHKQTRNNNTHWGVPKNLSPLYPPQVTARSQPREDLSAPVHTPQAVASGRNLPCSSLGVGVQLARRSPNIHRITARNGPTVSQNPAIGVISTITTECSTR
jgi:hypothetical protein